MLYLLRAKSSLLLWRASVIFFAISLPFYVCANGDLTTSVRVVREKQIQVPFPREFSAPPAITYMQFRHLDWSDTTNELAASAMQGAWLYIVNPETGVTRTVRTAQRGGERPLAWLPATNLLMAEGGLVDPYGNVQIYDTTTDLSHPATNVFFNRRTAVKGITLPDGRPAFVSFGESKFSSVDGGIKHYAYIHAAPEWKSIQRSQVFPNDGYEFHPRMAAITQAPEGIFVFVQAQYGKRGGDEGQDAWLFNLSNGKTVCRIDLSEGAATSDQRLSFGARGVGVSADARWMAVNTDRAFDLYDSSNCKRRYRLSGDNTTYPRGSGYMAPVFTSTGKYLLLAGSDVRSRKGGYLSIWRVADGKLIYHDEEMNPQALAVHPRGNRFVVGHDRGQLTFFQLND